MKKTFKFMWIGAIFFYCICAYANISLLFPADCKLGENCYIQLYVDKDPSKNAADIAGRHLTNDNHNGTDIAIATYHNMDAGVAVLAAAPGVVSRFRNHISDNRNRNYQYSPNLACGNGVIIEHSNGWETQYCHLKKGSVIVKPGEKVEAGQKLGEIGSSGKADFPHIHFTVRHNNQVVDPFEAKLWQEPMGYSPFGLIDMGMTDRSLKHIEVLDNPPKRTIFMTTEPAIIAWIRVYGVEKYDRQRFIFKSPKGNSYVPATTPINKDFQQWFGFAGFKLANRIYSKETGIWKVYFQLKSQTDDKWHTLGEVEFELKEPKY